MGRLRRFFSLSGGERRLLIGTWFLLLGVRTGLMFLKSATLQRMLERVSKKGRSRRCPEVASKYALECRRIHWAVTRAGRFVPGATCLVQALVAESLLRRRGLPARIRYGVRREGENRLSAHAWVESGEVVVVGDFDLDRYEVLNTREERTNTSGS